MSNPTADPVFRRGFAVKRLSDGLYMSMGAYGNTIWEQDIDCAYPYQSEKSARADALSIGLKEFEIVPGGRIL